jgi:hypothetical protein
MTVLLREDLTNWRWMMPSCHSPVSQINLPSAWIPLSVVSWCYFSKTCDVPFNLAPLAFSASSSVPLG